MLARQICSWSECLSASRDAKSSSVALSIDESSLSLCDKVYSQLKLGLAAKFNELQCVNIFTFHFLLTYPPTALFQLL